MRKYRISPSRRSSRGEEKKGFPKDDGEGEYSDCTGHRGQSAQIRGNKEISLRTSLISDTSEYLEEH